MSKRGRAGGSRPVRGEVEGRNGAARATESAAAIVRPGGTSSLHGCGAAGVAATEVPGGDAGVGGEQMYSPCRRRGGAEALTSAQRLRRLGWKCRHRGAGPGKADYNSQHSPRHTSRGVPFHSSRRIDNRAESRSLIVIKYIKVYLYNKAH